MHKQRFIIQDVDCGWQSKVYQAIGEIACAAEFKRLRVAVAYASRSGCGHLVATLRAEMGRWRTVKKQWLTGIDFGQTAPEAIEYLGGLDNSEVRVSDAAFVLHNHLVYRLIINLNM